MADSITRNVGVVFTVSNDKFNHNLKETNAQIKLTQQGLKLVEQNIKTYGNNLVYLGSKQDKLKEQETNLNKKLELLNKAFTENNRKLNENKTKLEELNQKKKDLSTQIKEATKEYGKESQEVANLKEKLQQTKEEYTETNNKIKTNVNALNNNQREILNTKTQMSGLQAQIRLVNTAIVEQSNKFIQASRTLDSLGKRFTTFGNTVGTVGSSLMKIGVPFALVTAGVIKSAIDFESAWTGVTKTVDGTEEELADLRQGILDMSTIMPESAVDIAKVAESAGQLGIHVPKIKNFSKTIVELGDSTNLTLEEGAMSLAKFANITNMSQDDFERLGSTVVDLGNHFATTEADIVNMAMRLAGAGSQIGLSQAEIMGIATALSSVGIEAEMGGSAFSKAMVKMKTATEIGSTKTVEMLQRAGMSLRELQLMSTNDSKDFKDLASSLGYTTTEMNNLIEAGVNLQNFSEIAHMSTQDFINLFNKDAPKAIEAFISGLADTEGHGESTIAMLQEMGFTEVRLSDTLRRLANGHEMVGNAISTSRKAWEENTALQTEASKRYETTASKLEMAKNKLKEVGITLGEEFLPFIIDSLDVIKEVADKFGALDKSTQKTILQMGALTFVTGGVFKSIGSTSKGIGALVSGIGKMYGWLGKITTATATASTGVASATSTVATATTGLSAMLPVLGALGGAIAIAGLSVYAYNEYQDMMNKGITQSTDDMSLMQKALSLLTGEERYSKEELEKMNIKYKEFSEDINPEVKKALEEDVEKIRNLQTEIDLLDIGKAITDDEKNKLHSQVDDICQGIIAKLQTLQSESINTLKATFMLDGIIDESEQKILDSMDIGTKASVKKIQDANAEINRIIENGEINTEKGKRRYESLMLLIEDSYGQELIAKKKANQQDIEAFESQANGFDLAKTKEFLKEKLEVLNNNEDAIRKKYDDSINLMKQQLNTANDEQRKVLEKNIKKNEELRDTELKIEEEKYDGYLKILGKKYPDIMNKLNNYSAEELSREEKQKLKLIESYTERFDRLDLITQTGGYRIYDSLSKTWNDCFVKVDQATGNIVGIYNKNMGICKAITSDMEESIKKLGDSIDIEAINTQSAMNVTAGSVANFANSCIMWNGHVAGSLSNVTQNADGTYSAIANVNGTPLEIKTNAKGVITDVKAVKNEISSIPNEKNVKINVDTTLGQFNAYKNNSWNDILNPFGTIGGRETGDSNIAKSGIYNVNEKGWELFENTTRGVAISNIGYEQAFLPQHTRVINHLQSTADMKRSIDENVNIKMSEAIRNMTRGIGKELAENINVDNGGYVEVKPNITLIIGGKEYRNFLSDIENNISKAAKRRI